jgi:hypothetical protein
MKDRFSPSLSVICSYLNRYTLELVIGGIVSVPAVVWLLKEIILMTQVRHDFVHFHSHHGLFGVIDRL